LIRLYYDITSEKRKGKNEDLAQGRKGTEEKFNMEEHKASQRGLKKGN
jgi:hypothetical protein